MLTRFAFVKRFSVPQSAPSNTAIPSPIIRGYKITSGTFKQAPTKIIPSTINDVSQIQSDTSGHHKVSILKICADQTQCHKRQCDSTHEDVCPHKKEDPNLIAELGGALTHKIPPDKEGILLDTIDGNGKPQLQYMVKEKTAVPVFMKDIKEDPKMAEYVQQSEIAKKIAENMPLNSTLTMKNTSADDTPLDHD